MRASGGIIMNHLLPPLRSLFIAILIGIASAHALRAQSSGPIIRVGDLDFGTFVLGMEGPKTLPLVICNDGTDTLTFDNPNDPDPLRVLEWIEKSFTVNQSELASLRLARLGPGMCDTVMVTFTPNTADFFQTTARFWGSTRNGRDTSVWRAVVLRPGARLSGHDFGTRWGGPDTCSIGAPHYEALIRLRNFGTSPARVAGLELVDRDAADGYFALDSSERITTIMVGDEARPGDSLRQRVRFMPNGGDRQYAARVRLITETGDTLYSVLTGNASSVRASVTNTRFDTVGAPGQETNYREVTIRAGASGPLTITNFTIGGVDAAEFMIDPTHLPALPLILLPGQSITIRVGFRPQGMGLRRATLTFHGDRPPCDDSTAVLEGFVGPPSGVEEERRGAMALDLRGVMKAGEMVVRFDAGAALPVRIEIFNTMGEPVARLLDERVGEGSHAISWNTAGVPGGVYYCRMTAGAWSRTVPVTLAR
jgi:hypothetical protein